MRRRADRDLNRRLREFAEPLAADAALPRHGRMPQSGAVLLVGAAILSLAVVPMLGVRADSPAGTKLAPAVSVPSVAAPEDAAARRAAAVDRLSSETDTPARPHRRRSSIRRSRPERRHRRSARKSAAGSGPGRRQSQPMVARPTTVLPVPAPATPVESVAPVAPPARQPESPQRPQPVSKAEFGFER